MPIYYTVGGKIALSGGKPLYITPNINFISAGYEHYLALNSYGRSYAWGINSYGENGFNNIYTINYNNTNFISGTTKTFCQISGGFSQSSAIDFRGKVWSWGLNTSGQLGDYTKVNKSTPISILGSNKTFCKITNGYYHTTSLDLRGFSWSWGSNSYGQLGVNSITDYSTPVAVLGVNKTFCKIIDGGYHTSVLDFRGKAWGWGYNASGQLGNYTVVSQRTPVALLGVNKTFCYISAGYSHTVGLDFRGKIWGWGLNTSGQLGLNSVVAYSTPIAVLGANKTFCKVNCGVYHTLALDLRGRVWGWGYNGNGQLGDNSVTNRCTPVAIAVAKTFCSISTGNEYSIGIDYNGKCWGWGEFLIKFPLLEIMGASKTFCQISGFVQQNAGGPGHIMVTDIRGKVWTWGDNYRNQLGDGTVICRSTPVTIIGATKTFCQISAGTQFSMAIDLRGKIWGWGYDAKGQLGNQSIIQIASPVSVLGSNKTFCKITAGHYHTLSLDLRGKAWGWGYNVYGGLGINTSGTNSGYSTPVAVLGAAKTFCQLSAGKYHSLGIDFRGKAWGWGYNFNGQVGNNASGAGSNRSTPIAVLGAAKTFCLIVATGNFFSLALDLRGKAWGWGLNSSGQLGDYTVTSRLTPVSVKGTNKTFCQISGSYTHSSGLDFRGNIWSWGNNAYGQLGDNSIINKSTPVILFGNNKTFCKVVAGVNYTIGVDLRGKTWSWGYNNVGQLGMITRFLTPIQISF